MRHLLRGILAGGLVLSIAAAALAADAIEIRLKDGSRWRGDVSDYLQLTILEQGIEVELKGYLVNAGEWHITVDSDLAGEIRRKTIFKGDILAIRTVLAEAEHAGKLSAAPGRADRGRPSKTTAEGKTDQPGVFVLPLEETVGIQFRHEEMEKIAEEADKYGAGQIIVLVIDSGGGLVIEMERIHETLMEIKKRHRLVAWIKKAISAACATALHCDEIYFMTEGTAGAMTAFGGDKAWEGEKLKEWRRRAGEWAEEGGRSRYIAESMIHAPLMLSYDKDAETGEVTFYNDLSGKHALSRPDENLVFTASLALECGFSDGTADTEEQLAQLLDLPKWNEVSDYGRKIAERWLETVERAQSEIPRTLARLEYYKEGTGDPIVALGAKIRLYEELKDWHDRCPNAAAMAIPWNKEQLVRIIANLRKELADMQRAQRRY
ncbi:MAG: Clp protease/crotonase-like domain-containing protein [Planctomycetota bacterium]|jgi:hypothetical protein